MLDLAPFVPVLPLFLFVLISPGPGLFIVSKFSLSHGRRTGIVCGLGMALSEMILAGLSLWGVGLFFQEVPEMAQAVRFVGGMYLIYLGGQFFKIRWPMVKRHAVASVARPVRTYSPFWLGALINLTNPAVVAFFTSAFAMTVTPDMSCATKAAVCFLSGAAVFVWFLCVAMTMSLPRVQRGYQAASLTIDRIAGALLVGYGVHLIWIG